MKLLILISFQLLAMNDLRRGDINVVDNNQSDLVDRIYEKCEQRSNIDMQKVAEGEEAAVQELQNCITELAQSEFQGDFEDSTANVVALKENEGLITTQRQSALSEKIGDHLKEKLNQGLRGEDGNKLVDHQNYYTLYQSQLTKNITLHINSYCLEGNFEEFDNLKGDPPRAPADAIILLGEKEKKVVNGKDVFSREKWRKQNKNRLSQQITVIRNYKDSGPKPVPLQQAMIETCVSSLRPACDLDKDADNFDKDSKQRACSVLQKLRAINKSLDELEGVLAGLKIREEKKNTRNEGFGLGNVMELYDANDSQNGIDALTSLTSADFNDKIKQDVDDINCQNLQSEKCREQLAVIGAQDIESEDQQKVIAKQIIKTGIVSYGLENADKEALEKILKAEGYDELIDELDADVGNKLAEFKSKLKNNYDNERQQALEQMRDRLNGSADNVDDINIIRTSLDKTGSELSDLLFFNNIITGYLEVSGGQDGESGRNIASFEREITAQKDSENPDSNLSNLERAFEDLDPGNNNSSTPTLDAKTVREEIIRDISSEDSQADTVNPGGSN